MTGRTPAETNVLANKHLLYEVVMTAGLVKRFTSFREMLSGVTGPVSDPHLDHLFSLCGRNADVESFVVHARVLVDFLYGSRKKEGDAVAADFFHAHSDWRTVRPKKSISLNSLKKRVAEEVVHLSYERQSPSPEWDYTGIWRDLSKVLRVFIDEAAPEYLSRATCNHIRMVLAPQVVTLGAGPTGVSSPINLMASGGTATSQLTVLLPGEFPSVDQSP